MMNRSHARITQLPPEQVRQDLQKIAACDDDLLVPYMEMCRLKGRVAYLGWRYQLDVHLRDELFWDCAYEFKVKSGVIRAKHGLASVGSWMKSTLRRRLFDYWKQEARHRVSAPEEPPPPRRDFSVGDDEDRDERHDEAVLARGQAKPRQNPEQGWVVFDKLARAEETQRLWAEFFRHLEALSPRDQELIRRVLLERERQVDVARDMGLKMNTVNQIVSRFKRALSSDDDE